MNDVIEIKQKKIFVYQLFIKFNTKKKGNGHS